MSQGGAVRAHFVLVGSIRSCTCMNDNDHKRGRPKELHEYSHLLGRRSAVHIPPHHPGLHRPQRLDGVLPLPRRRSRRLAALATDFGTKRPIPTPPRTGLPHSPDRRLRWKGYAPAERWHLNHQTGKNEWQPVVIEITEETKADLQGRELRGLVIEMKRQGDRANSILRATVIEDPTRLKRLGPTPPWFDMRPILERLWGMSQFAAPTARPETSGATDNAGEPPDLLPFPSAADETPPATADEEAPHHPQTDTRQDRERRRLWRPPLRVVQGEPGRWLGPRRASQARQGRNPLPPQLRRHRPG